MRVILAILLAWLALPTHASAADCGSEFAAVVTAMRTGGPTRREDVVTKNGAVVEKMVVDFSPPDQMKQEINTTGFGIFKTFVSGAKTWTVSNKNGRDDPPKMMDGAQAAKSYLENAMGLENTNAPLIDCPADGKGTLTLTWKGEDKDKAVLNVATVDANTHRVKTLTRSTLDKSDNTKFGRNSTYTVIPAFTVAPPAQ